MPLLAMEKVTQRFGGLTAVDALDFTIEAGAIVAMIGPNGAGKSTAFNLITGIYTPSAGRIVFDGTDITGRATSSIAALGIGRTFQNVRLFGFMSALDNVLCGEHARLHANLVDSLLHTPRQRREEAAARERATAMLEFVGLGRQAESYARNLAYGLQRRLEIGRALASKPKLLLLDEPAAGMNPNETHEVTELIGRLRDELGLAILVIEHDMHVVEGISDRVVALDHGVKIAEGSYKSVATHPAVIEAYLGRDPEALAEE